MVTFSLYLMISELFIWGVATVYRNLCNLYLGAHLVSRCLLDGIREATLILLVLTTIIIHYLSTIFKICDPTRILMLCVTLHNYA